MTAIRRPGNRMPGLVLGGVAALSLGLMAPVAASALQSAGLKGLAALIAGAGVIVVAIRTHRPKEVLLGAWVLALTYNRQYFSFEELTGDQGSHGLYWVPADLPFLGLLLISVSEALARRRAVRVPGVPATALPIIPLLLACFASTLLATRADWAFYDTVRVAKFTLILVWLQRNLTRPMWWTAVASLGLAVALQSGLGILQVAFKADQSLLASVGLREVRADDVRLVIENRARGTIGHPNFLAPWLLMLVPAAFGATIAARTQMLRLLCGGVTLLGAAGMVATESRGPAALLVVAFALVVGASVRLRLLSAVTAVGGGILASVFTLAALLPLAHKIADRVSGDFGASVTFRESYNAAAIAIWNTSPLLGIGPNNITLELGRHVPLLAGIIRELESFRAGAAVRAFAPVHNLYLLFLCEVGLIGLAALIWLLGAGVFRGVAASRRCGGLAQGVAVGLTAGLVVQCMQQTIDFSLWFDCSWYTFALLLALLVRAPGPEAGDV